MDERYLVDVTAEAHKAGFDCPVMLSNVVWRRCVEWDETACERQSHREQGARLSDLLLVPAMKLKRGYAKWGPDGMGYEIYGVTRGLRSSESTPVNLRLVPMTFERRGEGFLIHFDS